MNNETRYYHGLAGGIPFWCGQAVLDESVKTLESILRLGGIHCRSYLKEYGINYDEKEAFYNGDDYISLCIDNPGDEEFIGINSGLDSSFYRYVKKKIGIELKPEFVSNCVFREFPYNHLPGERQILGSIDASHISRILIGVCDNLKEEAIERIREICSPYNIPVMTFEEAERLDSENKKLIYRKDLKSKF